MKTLATCLGPVVLLAASVVAGCGDSSDAGGSGSTAVDQCTGAGDLEIIAALAADLDGGAPDGGVPDGGPYPYAYMEALIDEIDTCANQMCIGAILMEDDAEQCMSDCLMATDAAGLSDGCIACQGELIRCAAASCLNVCLGDDQDLCDACGLENCGARQVACTGLPQPLP